MIPVSFGQHRLWLLDRFERTGWTYNIVVQAAISGPLDVAALDAAVGDVLARHEVLRTSFPDVDGTPVQQIAAPPAGGVLHLVDATRDDLPDLLEAGGRHLFDLTRQAPVHARLLRTAPEDFVLQLVFHHIVVDGWSVRPLMRDLAHAYSARLAGTPPTSPPLPVQFADFAAWQREVLGSVDDPTSLLAEQLGFWRTALAGMPDEIALPTDRHRPAVATHRGGGAAVSTGGELHARLRQIAQESGASLFMVLHAALAALLHRLGGGDDIPIGTGTAGRSDEALTDLVGFFVNTVALRTDLSGDPTWLQLIDRVRGFDLSAFDHQDAPFEAVVHAAAPQRRPGRHPLFQTMLELQNHDTAVPDFPGLDVRMQTAESVERHSAKFDLYLDLAETFDRDGTPTGIRGHVNYATDLFDHDSAALLARRFTLVLDALSTTPDAPVSHADILVPGEADLLGRTPATPPDAPTVDTGELAALLATDPSLTRLHLTGDVPAPETLAALHRAHPHLRPTVATPLAVLDRAGRPAPLGVTGTLPTGQRARRRPDGHLELPPPPAAADRDAPVGEAAAGTAGTTEAGRPRTPAQEILCGIFADLLGRDSVNLHDDFFDLGGQSLLAVRVASRVRTVFDTELDLATVFRASTVAKLDAHIRQSAARPRVTPRRIDPRPSPLPLSPAQLRLWMTDQIQGPSASYNVPIALRLRGDLDATALHHALNDLIARHEALRTEFHDTDGEPHQHVLSPTEAHLHLHRAGYTTEADLAGLVAEQFSHVFDLARGPLVRAHLFTRTPGEHVLLLLMHHTVCDGWSTGPLLADLTTAYTARLRNAGPQWPELALQYPDYTLWQHELLGDETDEQSETYRQLAFWRATLAGLPAEATLAPDRPRSAMADPSSDTVAVSIAPELHAALLRLSRETGTTLFMALHASFAVLLARLGAGNDIPIGTSVAGRTHAEFDELVGFLINTVVLRADLSVDVAFREFLARVGAADLAALAHQDVPFDKVVQAVNPPRATGRNPLFQVGFTMEHHTSLAFGPQGLAVEAFPMRGVSAKLDLDLTLTETLDEEGSPAGVLGTVEYPTALYDRATVTRAVGEFGRLLESVVATPGIRLSALGVICKEA
ncbi:condensation domain-containing protein [Kitasatospora sp. NBC_00039]|uniref:condensation domain-containing protein n=1 Tax=Kitasatospora sp. NBC_00039 TaxID=2903565 RepID=UPI0032510DDC